MRVALLLSTIRRTVNTVNEQKKFNEQSKTSCITANINDPVENIPLADGCSSKWDPHGTMSIMNGAPSDTGQSLRLSGHH